MQENLKQTMSITHFFFQLKGLLLGFDWLHKEGDKNERIRQK